MPAGRSGPALRSGRAVVAATEEVLATGIAAGWELLTAAERRRAAALRRVSDQRDYVAAHVLVRWCAAGLLAVSPAEVSLVQRCPTCGGPHGPPRLAGLVGVHVSLAHTTGWVAAAVAGAPVGVDVETVGSAPVDPGLLDAVLTPAERSAVASSHEPAHAFRRLWVRKEALVKVGHATLDTLRDLDLSALPLDDASGGSPVLRYGSLSLREWCDHGAAVLAAAASTQELRWDRWTPASETGRRLSVR